MAINMNKPQRHAITWAYLTHLMVEKGNRPNNSIKHKKAKSVRLQRSGMGGQRWKEGAAGTLVVLATFYFLLWTVVTWWAQVEKIHQPVHLGSVHFVCYTTGKSGLFVFLFF